MTANQDKAASFDQADHNARIFSDAGVADLYLLEPIAPCEVMALIKYRSDYFQKAVLDIGVGTGRTTRYLLPFASAYVGIDLSDAMLNRCRTLFPGAALRKMDMRSIDTLESAPFDFVFGPDNVLDAVSHEDRLAMLKTIHKILVPGGLLAFSAHNRNWHRAGRGPTLEKSRNPITLMRRCAEHVRNVRNHRRMRKLHQDRPEYALLNDVSHSWKALHYYITRDAQEAQLRASGFDLLEVFDEQGRSVGAGSDDSANGWLLYICRRHR